MSSHSARFLTTGFTNERPSSLSVNDVNSGSISGFTNQREMLDSGSFESCFLSMKYKVAVLAGGLSEEREVSLVSSRQIAGALRDGGHRVEMFDPLSGCDSATKTGPMLDWYGPVLDRITEMGPDIVFIGLHGGEGEDGRVQSLLSMAGLPFTGSGFAASALCMNKYQSALLAASVGAEMPAMTLLTEYDHAKVTSFVEQAGLPVVVKPNDSGSSIGITVVQGEEFLAVAVGKALEIRPHVMLQTYVPGSELTVSILGRTPLPVVEIRPRSGWYDYHNKYTSGATEYIAPAEIPDEVTRKIQNQAVEIFNVLGCQVYGRVDFRYDRERIWFLETNTLPGMTPLSLTPKAAACAGLDFCELLEKIIDMSLNG